VKVELGPQAQVASATLARSSGYPNLDKAAVAAVGKWRAHQRYAGQRYVVPVIFTLHGYRRH
jgi:TonB family protein